jgi:hypothetical protein
MRKKYEIQLSRDWLIEINLRGLRRFGFLLVPAAIHLRLGTLWISLVNEAVLHLSDRLCKYQMKEPIRGQSATLLIIDDIGGK